MSSPTRSEYSPRQLSKASASQYPNKIVINTIDTIKWGLGVASTKLTILSLDTTDEELALAVRKHLNLTEFDLPNPVDPKSVSINFSKAAGFKNESDSYRKAKRLNIVEQNGKIKILANWNKGRSAFEGIKGSEIEVESTTSDTELGRQILIGWTLCEGGI